MRSINEVNALRRSLGLPSDFSKGGPPPPADLSTHALSVLESCPKQYEHRYLLRSPKGPFGGSTQPQRVGKLVHRALFLMGLDRVGTDSGCSSDDVLNYVTRSCSWEKESGLREARAAYDILRPLVRKLTFGKAVAFEEPIMLKFGQDLRLTGQLDRLDDVGNALEIWDYKCSEDVKDEDAQESDTQILSYLAAVRDLLPKEGSPALVFKTWYLIPDVVTTTSWDPVSDKLLRDMLVRKRGEIVNAQRWPATPGRACDSCPWKHACLERSAVLHSQAMGADVPFFAGDDEQLLKERQRLKGVEEIVGTQRKLLDAEALRPRLANGGSVIGGGLKAILKSCRAQKRYPSAEVVMQQLHALDIEVPNPLLSTPFDKPGLERWLRSLHPDYEAKAREALEKLATFSEGGSYVEVRKT